MSKKVLVSGTRVGADALTEATKLIYVRFVPNLVKLGVLPELAVLEGLSSFAVKNRHFPLC